MWKLIVVCLATSVISDDVNRRSWVVARVPNAEETPVPFLPNVQATDGAPPPNDLNLQLPLLTNEGAPLEVPQVPNGSNLPLTNQPEGSQAILQNGPSSAPPSGSSPNGISPPISYYPSNILPNGQSPSAVPQPNGLPPPYYPYNGLLNSQYLPTPAEQKPNGFNAALANLPPNILSNHQQSAGSLGPIPPNKYFPSPNYGQYPASNTAVAPHYLPPITGSVPIASALVSSGSNFPFGGLNYGQLSPQLNIPPSQNCQNTEVLLRVWTIFSNLLDTGGNPVQTPDAGQIKFALTLIKKYLEEAPHNVASVDVAKKLIELETDLLKNKGVILTDDRPLSNLLTINPAQVGPSVSFKYELPTNMRPACRKAFLTTIESAQEAYRNLAKSEICTGNTEAPQYPNNGYVNPGYPYNVVPVVPNQNPYGAVPPVSQIPPAKSDNALKTILEYLKNHDSRPKEIVMNYNSLPTNPYFPTIDTTKGPQNPTLQNQVQALFPNLNLDQSQEGTPIPNDLVLDQSRTPITIHPQMDPSGINAFQPQSPFVDLPGPNVGQPQSPFANLPIFNVGQPQSPLTKPPGLNVGQYQSPFSNLPGFNVGQPHSPFANLPIFNVDHPHSPMKNRPGSNVDQPHSPWTNPASFNVGQPQWPLTNQPGFDVGQPQSPFTNLPIFNVGQSHSPLTNPPVSNVGQPHSSLTNPPSYHVGQPQWPLTNSPGSIVGQSQAPLTNLPELNVGHPQPVITLPINIDQLQSPLSNPTGLSPGQPFSPLNPAGFNFGLHQTLFTSPPAFKVGQPQAPFTNPSNLKAGQPLNNPPGHNVGQHVLPMNSRGFNIDQPHTQIIGPTVQSLFPPGNMDFSKLLTPNSPTQNDFPSYLNHIKSIADKLNALNPNQNAFYPGGNLKNSPVNLKTNPPYNPLDQNPNMLQNVPVGNDGVNNPYAFDQNPTQSYLVSSNVPDFNNMYPGKPYSPDINNLNPYATNNPLDPYQNPYQNPYQTSFDNTQLTNPNNYQLFNDKVPTNDFNTIANFGKLNPNTKSEIELTYVLKRPKPLVYQPFYFVKYRLPYNNFVKDVGKLMSQNSLRTSKADLYKNLIEMYNASEIPPDLAHLPKEQVKDLVIKTGALINARLIPSNDTEMKGVGEKIINRVNLTNHVVNDIGNVASHVANNVANNVARARTNVDLPQQTVKVVIPAKSLRVKRSFVTDTGSDHKPSVEFIPTVYQTGII